jgi:hypothetical protein
MAVRKKDGGASAPTEEVVPEVLNTVSIRVKKPNTRRWRAGMCFTQEPHVESVSDAVLEQMQADALLIVEIVQPAPAAPADAAPVQAESDQAAPVDVPLPATEG